MQFHRAGLAEMMAKPVLSLGLFILGLLREPGVLGVGPLGSSPLELRVRPFIPKQKRKKTIF